MMLRFTQIYQLLQHILSINMLKSLYYRRRFKTKSDTHDKQTVEMTNPEIAANIFGNSQEEFEKMTISVEPPSQHEENTFPTSSQEYILPHSLTHSIDITDMDMGKDNVARRRKCCTPVSPQMLRRSSRYIENLNGCKPIVIS